MNDVDIGEVVLIVIVFIVGAGSFVWTATRTK